MGIFRNVGWLLLSALLWCVEVPAQEPRETLGQPPDAPTFNDILRTVRRSAPAAPALLGDDLASPNSDAPTPRDRPPAPLKTQPSAEKGFSLGSLSPPSNASRSLGAIFNTQPTPRRRSDPSGESAVKSNANDPAAASPPLGDPLSVELVEDDQSALADEMTADDQSAPPPGEELTAELRELRDKVRRCLAIYYFKPVYAENHSPWGIMHTMLSFGVDSQISAGGQRVNAAGWLSWNGPCRSTRLMRLQQGGLEVREGPGFQGHQGQFLAMLAQSRIRVDHELRVDGKTFTVADLVEYEKRNVRAGAELTFPLIALMHYENSDVQWNNRWGQPWSIPKLIQEEIRAPVNGAACGGVHRLMSLSYAVRKRVQRKETLDGEFQRAKRHVDQYMQMAFQMQNPDGSLSTNWFEGRGADPNIQKRLQTTGHILEWLVYSTREESLSHPKIVQSVNYLTDLMLRYPSEPWEIGPRGHALRALAVYDERAFGGRYGQREAQLAEILDERGDQRLTLNPAVKMPNHMTDETDDRSRLRWRDRLGR